MTLQLSNCSLTCPGTPLNQDIGLCFCKLIFRQKMTRLRFRLLKLKQVSRRTSALFSLASLANPTTFARSSHCRCKKTTTINNIGSQIIHIYNFRSLGPDCLKAVNKRIMRLCLSGASHPRGSLPGQFAFFHTWIMEYLHAWVFETTYQQNFEIIQLNQLILPAATADTGLREVSAGERRRVKAGPSHAKVHQRNFIKMLVSFQLKNKLNQLM